MGLAFYRSMYTKVYYINTMDYFSSIENDNIIYLKQGVNLYLRNKKKKNKFYEQSRTRISRRKN
mgnify:CR=1 FL=1